MVGPKISLDGGFVLLRFDQRRGIIACMEKLVGSLQYRVEIGLLRGGRREDRECTDADKQKERWKTTTPGGA